MWDKPYRFVLFNLGVYVPSLYVFGFKIAPFITLFFALFIIAYNLKYFGFINSLCLSILYLLIFDSDSYTFSPLHLRFWYLPLILLLVVNFFKGKITINKNSIFFFTCVLFLAIQSVFYLFSETFEFKFHIIKYWLFSIGLIYTLIFFFKKHLANPIVIIEYLFSLAIFVTAYGFFQYVFNLQGNFNLINTIGNVRPEAFFSETTWYAEYILLGFICAILLAKLTKNKLYLLFIVFFSFGLFISNTRNAFIGLAVFLVLEVRHFLVSVDTKVSFSRNSMISVFILLFLVFLLGILNFQFIQDQSMGIINKFDVKNEPSGLSRIQAFEVSIEMAKNTPLFGYGFYHDSTFEVGQGNTAVGAKSFNMLLMIYHIFGVFGFAIFLFIILCYLYLLVESIVRFSNIFFRMALSVFLMFITMAMFAPIHQFPFGMYYVAFSVYLFNCGLYEKSLFRNT